MLLAHQFRKGLACRQDAANHLPARDARHGGRGTVAPHAAHVRLSLAPRLLELGEPPGVVILGRLVQDRYL